MTTSEIPTSPSNIRPISILTAYILLAVLLTTTIFRTLLHISKTPSPFPASPRAQKRKAISISIFTLLSLLSLLTTWHYMLSFFVLSYKIWAMRTNTPLPTTLFGRHGIKATTLQLGPWLRDTTLFRDAWETVIDGNTRFWWSQQIFLISTVWSVALGVEGMWEYFLPTGC